MLTAYTSFIAIDSAVSVMRREIPHKIKQPLQSPQGVNMEYAYNGNGLALMKVAVVSNTTAPPPPPGIIYNIEVAEEELAYSCCMQLQNIQITN